MENKSTSTADELDFGNFEVIPFESLAIPTLEISAQLVEPIYNPTIAPPVGGAGGGGLGI